MTELSVWCATSLLGRISEGALKRNQTPRIWLAEVEGWRGRRRTESYIFMMNIYFNSRVIVHCVRVQRKYRLTQKIYITLDSLAYGNAYLSFP